MNQRPVLVGNPARELLANSLQRAAGAVVLSMGPNKRSVVYEFGAGQPRTACDGLSIANSVVDGLGPGSLAPRILKEALWEIRRDLGDGTCRLACISTAIHATAARRVVQGVDPGALAACMRLLAQQLPGLLEQQRCNQDSRLNVAMSACCDAEIAEAVATHSARGGPDDLLEVAEGWRAGIECETIDGFCLDIASDIAGLANEAQGARLVFAAAAVLVVNEVIEDFGPLAKVLDGFAQHRKSLIIVARGFVGAARTMLTMNRASLTLSAIGLVPETAGERSIELLMDLCAATGATLVGLEFGTSLANVRPATLGRAARVVVTEHRAVFSGAEGSVGSIRERQQFVRAQIAGARYLEGDRQFFQRRAARLAGRWSQLRIGGATEAEIRRRTRSAREALGAIEAARTRGVIHGGGQGLNAVAALLCEAAGAPLDRYPSDAHDAAIEAVRDGCRAVARQLARNAGVEPGSLDVAIDVVDPLSTTEEILVRAISIASTLLSVEVLVC